MSGELWSLLSWLLVVQIVLVALLASVVGRIRKFLVDDRRRSATSQQQQQQSAASGSASGGDALPTVASLDPAGERPKTIPPSSLEWSPLTEEELGVMVRLQKWCRHPESTGMRFEEIPFDLLVAFVRGYAYRPDWPNASFAYLNRAYAWRREERVDGPPTLFMRTGEEMPVRRALFESYCQVGPIGWDALGHPVVLQRMCETPPDVLFADFDEAAVFQHFTYNREAQRAYCIAASAKSGKRVYKCVMVIDMVGLSFAHMSKQMLAMLKGINSLFSYHYPETVHKIYVINAPFVFSTMYALFKPLLHPITVERLEVCGGDVLAAFEAGGVKLDGGAIPAKPTSWSKAIETLRADLADDQLLIRGYLPPADAEAMRKLGLLK